MRSLAFVSSAVRSLADLVQDFAVEQGLLALALGLGQVDHVAEEVEGQVDGQRRLVSPTHSAVPERVAVAQGRAALGQEPQEPQGEGGGVKQREGGGV